MPNPLLSSARKLLESDEVELLPDTVPLKVPVEPWRGNLKVLGTVLGDRTRLIMLRELGRHGTLPIIHFVNKAQVAPSSASQHMKVLREAGVVVKAPGKLNRLHPSLQPAPGAEFLDLGHVLVRLPPV